MYENYIFRWGIIYALKHNHIDILDLEVKCKLTVIFLKENNVGKSQLKFSVQKNFICICAFLIISAHLNLNMKYIQDEKVLKIRMQF